MANFINKDFMLTSDTAQELYHTYAAEMPIIDYHCHLNPQMIANNHQFSSITEAWLKEDHYKWRAMRGNGINEAYITGDKSDWEKFEKWADTLPYTMRNPLYHWTHLELSQIFDIDKILNHSTAREIYDECNAKLSTPDYRAQSLIKKNKVQVLCTTDDPIDNLQYHQEIKKNPFGCKVLPTWRADKTMAVDDAVNYNNYLTELESASDTSISSYNDLFTALKKRHLYFADMGCRLSDHGLSTFYAEDYTQTEINILFTKIRCGKELTATEKLKYQSAVLFDLAIMDGEAGWTQQFHIGAIRNNNDLMFQKIGADSGYDAIHDLPCAAAGHKLLNRLNSETKLAKTIFYNLNPKDNEVLATMAYTFNDGSIAGKMQLGSSWWFLDQEDGIRKQLNTLSSLGLLSRFVGMLTDSRSFLSYPRHDYFRRILCDTIGKDIEDGKLPASEIAFIGQMIADISYRNAHNFFGF